MDRLRRTAPRLGQPWSAATYRRLARPDDLMTFSVRAAQTDMQVSAEMPLEGEAMVLVLDARAQIEAYIAGHPEFLRALVSLPPDPTAPPVVAAMLAASRQARVGPMAAVAGAIADFVGNGLAASGKEIIVENGGDIFLRSTRPREIALLAEHTDLAGLRVVIPPVPEGAGIATSAGTLGPSLSLGRADAVMIFAESGALADALATAIGNVVRDAKDLHLAQRLSRDLGARAAAIIADGHLAIWGDIELLG